MLLDINKEYILNTIQGEVYNKHVKVVGIINYEQTQKIPFDIRVLAENEGLTHLPGDSDFEVVVFYHCKIVGTNINIIVWDDIIDIKNTIEAYNNYLYETSIKVDRELEIPITSIITNVEAYAKNTYGITLTFTKEIEEGSESDYQAKIEESVKVLNKITNGLSSLAPVVDKMIEHNVTKTLSNIEETVDQIKGSVDYISGSIK